MTTRKQRERIHARKRAFERFGIDNYSRKDEQEIVHQIQTNKAVPVKKTSNRVTVFRVSLRGNAALAAYDKQRKTIVTFMKEKAA